METKNEGKIEVYNKREKVAHSQAQRRDPNLLSKAKSK